MSACASMATHSSKEHEHERAFHTLMEAMELPN
jgi:hypothetical protein